MTTNEERREAAKRKLEQRLEAERQQARKRRNTVIGIVSVVVVAVAAVGGYFWYRAWDNGRHTECSYADAPFDWDGEIKAVQQQVDAAPAAQKAQGNAYLQLLRDGQKKQRTAPKPPGRTLNTGTVTMTLKTNKGDLPLSLDRHQAPCNVNALVSLSKDGYYNDTSCHRLVARDTLSVLQCGDPTLTDAGGPGWTTKDELPKNLKMVPGSDQMQQLGMEATYIYPRGTVAIANKNDAQQGTSDTGSAQFFIVTKDSQLPASLSIVGHVDDQGMKVVDQIAKGGIDPGVLGTAQDGNPKTPLEIKTVSISD